MLNMRNIEERLMRARESVEGFPGVALDKVCEVIIELAQDIRELQGATKSASAAEPPVRYVRTGRTHVVLLEEDGHEIPMTIEDGARKARSDVKSLQVSLSPSQIRKRGLDPEKGITRTGGLLFRWASITEIDALNKREERPQVREETQTPQPTEDDDTGGFMPLNPNRRR